MSRGHRSPGHSWMATRTHEVGWRAMGTVWAQPLTQRGGLKAIGCVGEWTSHATDAS